MSWPAHAHRVAQRPGPAYPLRPTAMVFMPFDCVLVRV